MTSDIAFVFVGDNNNMTQKALRSAIQNCPKGSRVKVIVEPFCGNYNKSLNRAILRTNAPFIFACNNDVFFHENSVNEMLFALQNGYDSVGPWCPLTHNQWWRGRFPSNRFTEGYQTGKVVPGWVIGISRKAWEKIGMFDTTYLFWCSDNVYCDQLRKHKLRHALCRDAHVTHYQSQTLKTLNKEKYNKLTKKQLQKYQRTTYGH